MKLIDPKITILFDDGGMIIEVHDNPSSSTFLKVKLNPKQTCQALSRSAHTDCKVEVFNLDRVGKKMEYKPFEFPVRKLDEYPVGKDDKQLAISEVERVCPEGWIPDLYFGSQGSFFEKDDVRWARTTIRRYV